MRAEELPAFPAKGQRQKLDGQWRELLARRGLSPFLSPGLGPPVKLTGAVEEFNQGEYWKCHETLEELWLPEPYPLRLFYHGLIKAAVGLLHLERYNRRGAEAKLGDAESTLAPFLPGFMGLDVDALLRDVRARLALLQGEGAVDWREMERLQRVFLRPQDMGLPIPEPPGDNHPR